MYDAILGLIGQSGKQAAERDMADYDPSTGSLGEREGLEAFGDFLRGGSGSADKAARELHIKNLKPLVEQIQATPGATAPVVDYQTTRADLLRQAADAKRADQKTQREDARTELDQSPQEKRKRKKESDLLTYQMGRDTTADRRADQAMLESINARRDQTQLGMAQLDIARQQEANRMSEETRRYDQRRADSKKERMAAIIAGLANLGGAFAI